MTLPATDTQRTEQLVSVSLAASRLDISLRSLYRLIAHGELPPPLKVGRSSKLCQSDLDTYVQRLKSQRSN
ncbi:MAG: helix-turn-helix domain-containing protein [Verrucomicrobiota bacterium]